MTLAAASTTVEGRLDAEGRLVEADARLAELQHAAGGSVGGPLAIPRLATLARLAQKLQILVSRSVVIADGDRDMDLWVRAVAEGPGVRLTLGGWQPRAAASPAPADELERRRDFVRAEADWRWECDEKLRVVTLSSGGEAALGLSAEQAIGRPLSQLFALAQTAEGTIPLLDAMAESAPFEGQRAVLRCGERGVVLSGAPLIDGNGRFVGFSGGARMLDEPEPLTPAPDPLFGTRLNSALRAPLGRIIDNADHIRARDDGPLRTDYADYAGDIATAGRHLLGMIDDLADLQAVERPGFRPDAEPIDLADLARRAAGLLNVRAADRNVRIDRPADGETLPATGEFRRVLQILVNLIGNAVRYSPEGGMVWIRTEREGDLAAVIVADQGKGLAAADQEPIFDKFVRLDPAEAGGSGLGLYIARRLARAMGGDITVDSAPGQGARFVFTLPLAGQ